MTADPVSTGSPGWEEFLKAYNEFCSQHGGYPWFNQTGELTWEQIDNAFGERLQRFEHYRKGFDPSARLLNEYFGKLLALRVPSLKRRSPATFPGAASRSMAHHSAEELR
jgi:D-arabinono-1,4-lactone oxidase